MEPSTYVLNKARSVLSEHDCVVAEYSSPPIHSSFRMLALAPHHPGINSITVAMPTAKSTPTDDDPSGGTGSGIIIGAVVGGVGFVLILIIVIVVVIMVKNKNAKRRTVAEVQTVTHVELGTMRANPMPQSGNPTPQGMGKGPNPMAPPMLPPMAPPTATATAGVWQEVVDMVSGKKYYTNSVTGQSSWEKPASE